MGYVAKGYVPGYGVKHTPVDLSACGDYTDSTRVLSMISISTDFVLLTS